MIGEHLTVGPRERSELITNAENSELEGGFNGLTLLIRPAFIFYEFVLHNLTSFEIMPIKFSVYIKTVRFFQDKMGPLGIQ